MEHAGGLSTAPVMLQGHWGAFCPMSLAEVAMSAAGITRLLEKQAAVSRPRARRPATLRVGAMQSPRQEARRLDKSLN